MEIFEIFLFIAVYLAIVIVAVFLKESDYCSHCGFYCHGKSPFCTKGKTK
jgi:hypothetical protein